MNKPDSHIARAILVLFALLVVFATHLAAQTTTTSPQGWDQTEGPGISQLLGGYPDGRFQYLDGEVHQLSAKINQVEMRVDLTFAYDQPARTWQQVFLFLAHTDVQKHSSTLSLNALTTPQLVFLSKVSWPAVKNSTVATSTGPWGGINGEYRLPFRTPFAKTANRDLLVDFAMGQGSLGNNAAWTTFNMYPLDGFDEREETRAPSRLFGSTACRDSSQVRAAVCETGLFTYRKQAHTTQRADRVVAWLSTFFAAPSAPVVQAMGVIQSPGTPIGACQPLYVQPLTFVYANADSAGTASVFLGSVPYQPALAGLSIGAQAAYHDSSTQRFELTQATDSPIAKQEGPYLVHRVSYWVSPAGATQGWFADHSSNPLFRYTYQ